MVCQFCGHDKKLLKAHIIPEGFFRTMRHGKDMPFLLSSSDNAYPQKTPIGVYDPQILCEACERLFARWDHYAQEFFLQKHHYWKPLRDHSSAVGYEIHDYDYTSLKLFFVSLLWRASVSRHPFYEQVSLGSFEDIARQLIAKGTPGNEDAFSVVLAVFDDPVATPFLNPVSVTWADIRHYQFYLGDYIAYIKVDDRKTPEPFHDFVLKQTPPLYVISRNLHASAELPLMKKIAKENRDLVRRRKPADETQIE